MSQRIVPFLGYEDAAAAIVWLERAFGFRERRDERYEEDGTITHAELELEGSRIYLSTPAGYASPRTLRATCEAARRSYDNPWVIDGHFVEVDDLDAHHARAAAAGATILRPPEDPGIGHRIYAAEDPEGHRWMFGQRVGDSS
ncbi:MAG TPA: VOC family protein [Gaiellaceae bacterium]|nr:VOC family protein [Gaiellaceae bacterium]